MEKKNPMYFSDHVQGQYDVKNICDCSAFILYIYIKNIYILGV